MSKTAARDELENLIYGLVSTETGEFRQEDVHFGMVFEAIDKFEEAVRNEQD